jgi:hypothetical protein
MGSWVTDWRGELRRRWWLGRIKAFCQRTSELGILTLLFLSCFQPFLCPFLFFPILAHIGLAIQPKKI